MEPKVDPGKRLTADGCNALHVAAGCGHSELVQLLLAAPGGRRPWVVAGRTRGKRKFPQSTGGVDDVIGSKSVATLLPRRPFVDVTLRIIHQQPLRLCNQNSLSSSALWSADFETPLHYAVRSYDSDTVRVMTEYTRIRYVLRPDAQNLHGVSALHVAIRLGLSDQVSALLEVGANVDLKGSDGVTSLQLAVMLGNPEIVQLLVNAHAVCLPFPSVMFTCSERMVSALRGDIGTFSTLLGDEEGRDGKHVDRQLLEHGSGGDEYADYGGENEAEAQMGIPSEPILDTFANRHGETLEEIISDIFCCGPAFLANFEAFLLDEEAYSEHPLEEDSLSDSAIVRAAFPNTSREQSERDAAQAYARCCVVNPNDITQKVLMLVTGLVGSRCQ